MIRVERNSRIPFAKCTFLASSRYQNVSDRTLKGERVPEFLIDYLRGRANKMGLKDKSSESEGGELKRPAL